MIFSKLLLTQKRVIYLIFHVCLHYLAITKADYLHQTDLIQSTGCVFYELLDISISGQLKTVKGSLIFKRK